MHRKILFVPSLVAFLALSVPPAGAQGVCDGFDCDNLPTSICDAGGFKVTQTGFIPASGTNSGTATYTYEICSPALGTCVSTVRPGEACPDNNFCRTKGQNHDPNAYCTRECAVDTFRALSHFDILFPELGGLDSCLSEGTSVTGSCTNGFFVLGDGSCFQGQTSQSFVAKCDGTELVVGQCLTMTVNIAGELNGLGLGTTVVVSKESTDCNESCLAGPSCEPCGPPPGDGECLTRTLGFWGTHPWITNDYAPVTVCGKTLGCYGASDGKSDPSCPAGACDSIMEGLGSIGGESPRDSAYIGMVKQLTAAKLNLNATGALFPGADCGDWMYDGKTIQEWITYCEGLCGEKQSVISSSGCIEALNAFNNSEDTGFDMTPAPFDRPPVDDFGNVSGADPSNFTAAHGTHNPPGKWVIGKKVGNHDCR